MVLVKHKRVGFVFNGRRDFLILKPGFEVTKEALAEMFGLQGKIFEKIFLKRSPGDFRSLELPLSFHSVGGEGAEFFVFVKGRKMEVHRDPALWDGEGPEHFHLHCNAATTLASLKEDILRAIPGTPHFSVYHAKRNTRPSYVELTETNLHKIPENHTLYHIVHDKRILLKENSAYITITSADTFVSIKAKLEKALGKSLERFVLRAEGKVKEVIRRDASESPPVRGSDVMPSWRAVKDGGEYSVVETTQDLKVSCFGKMHSIFVTSQSAPTADVEDLLRISCRYFSLNSEKDGMTLQMQPLTLQLVYEQIVHDVKISHPFSHKGFEEEVSKVLALQPTEWDLVPDVGGLPVSRNFSFFQFCKGTVRYNVVLRGKHVFVTYGHLMVDVAVPIAVGSTHAENIKELSDMVGSNRGDPDSVVVFAQKAEAGGVVRGAANSPLSPRTAAARNLMVVQDISWSSVVDGQSIIITKGTKQIAVRTEEHWPSEITAGANEITMQVNETDGNEEIWKQISDSFDLKSTAASLKLMERSFYLTTISCDAPLKILSHQTLRDGAELLLCVPRKTVLIYSATSPSKNDPNLCLTVLPSDTHSDTLKAVEAHFGLSFKEPYRLFGPYSSKEVVQEVMQDVPRAKKEKLQDAALSYLNLREKQANCFLLCPPKRVTVVHHSLGVRCSPIGMGLTTSFAELLNSITKGFSKHSGGNRPSHLETEDGTIIEHLSYTTVDPLQVYYAVWGGRRAASPAF